MNVELSRHDGDTRIPVIVLTGFLGAGKTTVLRQMLEQPGYADHAVLINEFGAVGIDQQVVTPISPDVVLLDSGCLCCQIRGELKEALVGMLDQRARGVIPRFRGMVIETSGLAEPTPILATMQADPLLSHQLRVARTVTVVDAINGLATSEACLDEERAIWWHQVAAADAILISKGDLDAEAAHRLRLLLQTRLPGVPVMMRVPGQGVPDFDDLAFGQADSGWPEVGAMRDDHVAIDRMGNASIDDASWRAAPVQGPGLPALVQSLVLTAVTPIDWTAFGVWLSALLHVHGRAILRVKGILDIGEPYPILINGVQHQIHAPMHLDAWPGQGRRSTLVLIVVGIDPADLCVSFQRFVHAEAMPVQLDG